ncbi:MAG: methyl-accepting chemotaxis protein [Dyella sp.]
MTIRNKLIIGLALCAAVLLAVGAIGIDGQTRGNAGTAAIYNTNLEPILRIAEISEIEATYRTAIFRLILDGKASQSATLSPQISGWNRQIDAAWDGYYPADISTDVERRAALEFIASRKRMDAIYTQIVQHVSDNDFAGAQRLQTEALMPEYTTMVSATSNLLAENKREAQETFGIMERSLAKTRLVSVFTIAAGLLVIVMLLVVLIKAISTPVARAVGLANAIASGQLNHQIAITSNDEVGQLLHALQRMDNQLTGIVGEVRQSAESVATASRQIERGNDELSQRTQEQASSLEETAASMEQITSTVKQNAENAGHANHLAKGALQHTQIGATVVQQTVGAMTDIQQASHRISDIVGLIDEIAFQTNLLALNAAVEAARAGEQGRGFAVVATEVRSLAQRSATAAREIKALINDSTDKVDAGMRLANASDKHLADIHGSIKQVNDILVEIAAACAEQSSGIDQINTSVTQLDEVTQQNAALVEEAAAASRAMREQAGELTRQVSFFQIADNPAADRAHTARTPEAARTFAIAEAPISVGA